MRIDTFQSLEWHFGAKAALSYTSYTYCDICTVPASVSKALALGLLLGPHQRAWCNQSSWLICPMELYYCLLSILSIPEVFSSQKFILQINIAHCHRRKLSFFMMYATPFPSPQLSSENIFRFLLSSGFHTCSGKGGAEMGVTFTYFVRKGRNHLHRSTLAASTEVSAHAGSCCRAGCLGGIAPKGRRGRGTYRCSGECTAGVRHTLTRRAPMSPPPIQTATHTITLMKYSCTNHNVCVLLYPRVEMTVNVHPSAIKTCG